MKQLDPDPSTHNLPRHPFAWLPPATQLRVFVVALLLTLPLMGAIHVTNAPLENPAAPTGMISFQLAGTLPRVQKILDSWDHGAQLSAALNLGIDYLYLVAYATAIGLGCVLLARHFASRLPLFALAGVGLSWGMLAALLLDAVENYALIRLLFGEQRELWPLIARWCAIPKFALVLAALAYLAGGGLLAFAIRPRA